MLGKWYCELTYLIVALTYQDTRWYKYLLQQCILSAASGICSYSPTTLFSDISRRTLEFFRLWAYAQEEPIFFFSNPHDLQLSLEHPKNHQKTNKHGPFPLRSQWENDFGSSVWVKQSETGHLQQQTHDHQDPQDVTTTGSSWVPKMGHPFPKISHFVSGHKIWDQQKVVGIWWGRWSWTIGWGGGLFEV